MGVQFLRLAVLAVLLVPSFAHAATLIDDLTTLFSLIVPLLMGIAVVVFLWGIIKFIAHADNDKERTEGKQFMIWGMITLFIMVSLWAIVGFIQESLVPTSTGSLGALPMMPDNVPTP
jgi:heme/copper-type cytochrome/quinol oxidase subunit 2